MIIVDASVVLEALLPTPRAQVMRARLQAQGPTLHAPALIDVECAHALRSWAADGRLSAPMGDTAIADLRDFPIHRHDHGLLLGRIWELRHNLTAYDAAYVALAEAFDAPLLTRDARIAGAPNLRAAVKLV